MQQIDFSSHFSRVEIKTPKAFSMHTKGSFLQILFQNVFTTVFVSAEQRGLHILSWPFAVKSPENTCVKVMMFIR